MAIVTQHDVSQHGKLQVPNMKGRLNAWPIRIHYSRPKQLGTSKNDLTSTKEASAIVKGVYSYGAGEASHD